jgi:hypothetical protein
MAGSNPWFKNARVPIESLSDEGEDMTQQEKLEVLMETLKDRPARHIVVGESPPVQGFMARCGGFLRRNSIKQKTRLNRDRRNDR